MRVRRRGARLAFSTVRAAVGSWHDPWFAEILTADLRSPQPGQLLADVAVHQAAVESTDFSVDENTTLRFGFQIRAYSIIGPVAEGSDSARYNPTALRALRQGVCGRTMQPTSPHTAREVAMNYRSGGVGVVGVIVIVVIVLLVLGVIKL